jgi:hypothetical protein
MSHSRAMRRIQRAINRQIEETRPDRPLWTRRDLLRAAGLALAGALLTPSGNKARAQAFGGTSRTATPRIGIVGAGIAGVVAALTLRDAGVPCSREISDFMDSGHKVCGSRALSGQSDVCCRALLESRMTGTLRH